MQQTGSNAPAVWSEATMRPPGSGRARPACAPSPGSPHRAGFCARWGESPLQQEHSCSKLEAMLRRFGAKRQCACQDQEGRGRLARRARGPHIARVFARGGVRARCNRSIHAAKWKQCSGGLERSDKLIRRLRGRQYFERQRPKCHINSVTTVGNPERSRAGRHAGRTI
jgi:hypothetical protein